MFCVVEEGRREKEEKVTVYVSVSCRHTDKRQREPMVPEQETNREEWCTQQN